MNSIFKTTVLVFFFSFFLQDYCYSQTTAGRVTFSGQGEANIPIPEKDQLELYGLLETELGYVFFDRFLATALYRYETSQNVNRFSQRYATRYSIVRMLPIEIFTGLAYTRLDTWNTVRQLTGGREILTSWQRLVTGRFTTFFGSSYFLNPRIALESRVELKITGTNDFLNRRGDLGFNLGIRYFLDSNYKKETATRDSSFTKKRMLGFSLDLTDGGYLSLINFGNSFDMSIDFGHILGRRVMIGIETRLIHFKGVQTMNLEIQPFGRYYFWGLQNSKIYVEGQFAISLFSFSVPAKVSEIRKEVPVFSDAHLGLGWSRKMTENLRLDFFTGVKVYESFNKDWDSDPFFKSSGRILKCRFGIERYF